MEITAADCLDYLKSLDDECVDLVLIDPPYNIRHASWDCFPSTKEYVDWFVSTIVAAQRVMKKNAVLYFFHNDFPQCAEIHLELSKKTELKFMNLIIWHKPDIFRFEWKKINPNNRLSTWFNTTEYIFKYTFSKKGEQYSKIFSDERCFSQIRLYLRQEFLKLKQELNAPTDAYVYAYLNNLIGAKIVAIKYFGRAQWTLPSREKYLKMQSTGFFKKPYEELSAEYAADLAEYKNSSEFSSPFFKSLDREYNNVWIQPTQSTVKVHSCEKPQEILERIIVAHTRENDVVLDYFSGSGSTAIACKRLNRRFLGCEKDVQTAENANKRLNIK